MVDSERALSKSAADIPSSGSVMSPGNSAKSEIDLPACSATLTSSLCARSAKAGCTSNRKRPPSFARRRSRRPAMKPGKPVKKIVSSADIDLRITTQALHWDRGRPARTSTARCDDLAKYSVSAVLFALRAHGGRAARGPSEELERCFQNLA